MLFPYFQKMSRFAENKVDMAKSFSIPKEDLALFQDFTNLCQSTKEEVYNSLKSAYAGIMPKNLINKLYTDLNKKIEEKQAANIIRVYLSLINTYNAFELSSMDDFFPILEETLKRDLPELSLSDGNFSSLKLLLQSSPDLVIGTKISDIQTEQSKVFLEATTFQDIRPLFNDEGELLGSSIIHTLKITYKENDDVKYFYVALDNEDINDFSCEIEKTKQRINQLKTVFSNAKIINNI